MVLLVQNRKPLLIFYGGIRHGKGKNDDADKCRQFSKSVKGKNRALHHKETGHESSGRKQSESV
ncbi:MAG: hypothetical protein VZR10_08900 [Methanobrevibacter sp.]|nr:hypothetical protein [Methanobrevibacter sp.]